jgi:hypothetical protein
MHPIDVQKIHPKLTVYHMPIIEVDTWYYIKIKIKNLKIKIFKTLYKNNIII